MSTQPNLTLLNLTLTNFISLFALYLITFQMWHPFLLSVKTIWFNLKLQKDKHFQILHLMSCCCCLQKETRQIPNLHLKCNHSHEPIVLHDRKKKFDLISNYDFLFMLHCVIFKAYLCPLCSTIERMLFSIRNLPLSNLLLEETSFNLDSP